MACVLILRSLMWKVGFKFVRGCFFVDFALYTRIAFEHLRLSHLCQCSFHQIQTCANYFAKEHMIEPALHTCAARNESIFPECAIRVRRSEIVSRLRSFLSAFHS